MPSETARVQVLLTKAESYRLEEYCRVMGYKKSTLIARLVREHLDRESFPEQQSMFQEQLTGRQRI